MVRSGLGGRSPHHPGILRILAGLRDRIDPAEPGPSCCRGRRTVRTGYPTGVCLALLLFLSGKVRSAEPSAAQAEFFEKEVRPLLVEKCSKCHGEMRPRGGLRLTS